MPQPSIGQTIGPVPAWLTLGDPIVIDGIEVRPVIGDYSHLEPCDRPPQFITSTPLLFPNSQGFDRSPEREAVRQCFPGKPISELAATHTGKCVILFNGPSLAKHDLFKLTCPIIGMNRTHQGWPTYRGPQPDYLCLVDHVWFDKPSWSRGVLAHPRIINGSTHKADIGYRVTRHPRMGPFSFDLARDGYVGPIPCTTGYLALQLALYLGFSDIYCLGLDMQGGHFDGTKGSLHFTAARTHLKEIAKAIARERPEVRVWVCGSPDSAVTCWPQAPFSALTGEAEEAA